MIMRPCWAEIRVQAFQDNYRFLKGLTPADAELLAVVKSDAYGHSLAICAPAAAQAGARWLGVTSTEEGVAARALCPHSRILLMSGAFPGEASSVVEHGLTPVVWDPWQIEELAEAARTAAKKSFAVHLEIDTGMSRQGVALNNLAAIASRFGPEFPLQVEGLMTHLFAADEADGRTSQEQMTRFRSAVQQILAQGLRPELLSVGSSASLLNGKAADVSALAARFGMRAMIRPGLALYGIAPQFHPSEPAAVSAARAQLHPVLAWKTRVVSVRPVPAGAVVGYNGTFVATEPMRLALLALGYADGLNRLLGNRFSLLVRGQRTPLAGRISMDQAVVDVTEINGVQPGDEVVILGSQGAETISAFDHARASQTIPWEVFTCIGARVPRLPV
jgi:alanine racemase